MANATVAIISPLFSITGNAALHIRASSDGKPDVDSSSRRCMCFMIFFGRGRGLKSASLSIEIVGEGGGGVL